MPSPSPGPPGPVRDDGRVILRALPPLIASVCALVGCGAGPHYTVPEQYRPMIRKAADTCPGLDRKVLAAQLDQESGWSSTAVSRAGAEGIAQFMPETWDRWGRDIDGNDQVSPFDPADAIDAQGRLMCHYLELAESSDVPGEPITLALAAYNAGWSNVDRYRGVPPFPETQDYVQKIQEQAPNYRFRDG